MFFITVVMMLFAVIAIASAGISVATGEQKYLVASLICVLTMIIIALLAPDPYQNSKNACLNLGYAGTVKKGDNWYCVSYGTEPRIIQLDIEDE